MAPMDTGRIAQAPRATTAGEVKRLLELDRLGEPYLVLRDEHNELVGMGLAGRELIAVGRDEVCELSLPWDGAVSRLHAELVCRAGAWMVLDDGLSKNGTFVNGERVHGRRRLLDGDVLAFGATGVLFRRPLGGAMTGTSPLADKAEAVHVSPAQRKVLIELCRPFAEGSAHAVPAPNRAIAAALVISDEAVKSHMHALFGRFGIEDLPRNVKRARLVEMALRGGIVAPRELR